MGFIYYIFQSKEKGSNGGYIGQTTYADVHSRGKEHITAAYTGGKSTGGAFGLIQKCSCSGLVFGYFDETSNYGIPQGLNEYIKSEDEAASCPGGGYGKITRAKNATLDKAELLHILGAKFSNIDFSQGNYQSGGSNFRIEYVPTPSEAEKLSKNNMKAPSITNWLDAKTVAFKFFYPFDVEGVKKQFNDYLDELLTKESVINKLNQKIVEHENFIKIVKKSFLRQQITSADTSFIKDVFREGIRKKITSKKNGFDGSGLKIAIKEVSISSFNFDSAANQFITRFKKILNQKKIKIYYDANTDSIDLSKILELLSELPAISITLKNSFLVDVKAEVLKDSRRTTQVDELLQGIKTSPVHRRGGNYANEDRLREFVLNIFSNKYAEVKNPNLYSGLTPPSLGQLSFMISNEEETLSYRMRQAIKVSEESVLKQNGRVFYAYAMSSMEKVPIILYEDIENSDRGFYGPVGWGVYNWSHSFYQSILKGEYNDNFY